MISEIKKKITFEMKAGIESITNMTQNLEERQLLMYCRRKLRGVLHNLV